MPPKTKKGKKRTKKSTAVTMYTGIPKTSPMPVTFKTTLRYSQRIEINAGFTQTGIRVFSANGIAIPDALNPTLQPRGFDQLMPLYDHYTVLGSKITFDYANSDNQNQQLLTITCHDNFNVSTDHRDYMERGYGLAKTVVAARASGKSTGSLSLKCSPAKFLGVSNLLDEKDTQGSVNTNPVEQVYYHIAVSDLNGNEDSDPIHGWVTIDYIVRFQEPKFVGAS